MSVQWHSLYFLEWRDRQLKEGKHPSFSPPKILELSSSLHLQNSRSMSSAPLLEGRGIQVCTQLWITNTIFELLWSPDYFFSRWWLTLVHVTTDRKLTHYCRYHKIFMVIFSEHDHSIQINAVHYETYRFLQEFLVVWILASILGTQGKKEAGVIGVPADRSTNYN